MMKPKPKHRTHDESMAELFRRDQKFTARYLDDILRDGDAADLLVALRQISDATVGVSALARKAGLNSTQLYRTLSKRGNPGYKSLSILLNAMGLRLSVSPLTPTVAARTRRQRNHTVTHT